MKQNTRKVKAIVDGVIKKDLDFNSVFTNDVSTIIYLKFDFNTFYKKNTSVSHFFKKLVNNKNSLGKGLNNREWWFSLSKENRNQGFYKYEITDLEVSITLFLNSEKMVNELELKSRIKKISPFEMIIIEIIDSKEFRSNFSHFNHLESGFSLFGIQNSFL